ncbi:MAG: hypothetical protein KDD82_10430 [Planctomycetes bacterium]|nr:hypothetical protein [Planctomycetota bacterium]
MTVRRWLAVALLALLCLGACAHGLSAACSEGSSPVQDGEEVEAEEVDALLEERELRCEAPDVPCEALPEPATRAPDPGVRLRSFSAERRAQGAYLPQRT